VSDYYILKGREVVRVNSLKEWAQTFEEADRRVASDEVGDVRVSTVFLGLDHGFGSDVPIVFETMVFGGALDQEQVRYATYDEAEAGHKAMLERVKATLS
jgi:hypothetical protein